MKEVWRDRFKWNGEEKGKTMFWVNYIRDESIFNLRYKHLKCHKILGNIFLAACFYMIHSPYYMNFKSEGLKKLSMLSQP